MSWQDVLLVLIRHLIDVFLPTGPSQQTITCSKVATETQKQRVGAIQV